MNRTCYNSQFDYNTLFLQTFGIAGFLMPIQFTCECGQRLKADESVAGSTRECPQCGKSVAVPDASGDASDYYPDQSLAAPALPVVFISSTESDLREYRLKATEAANNESLTPRKMEYWPAKGSHPPLAECMQQITGGGPANLPPADVCVVIVAGRYGWVPDEQDGEGGKSITWLECLEAKEQGLELLSFVLDEEKQSWPEEWKESHRVMQAYKEGKTPEEIGQIIEDVRSNEQRLRDFKQWLGGQHICSMFTTADDLFNKVRAALADWKKRHPEFQAAAVDRRAEVNDPEKYLQRLCEEHGHIDIRGLQVESGKANRFGIEELYIPLTIAGHQREEALQAGDPDVRQLENPRGKDHIALDEALEHRRLVIIGDPGAGKTTFLRRIAFVLSQTLLGRDQRAAQEQLGLADTPFPIFIRIGELCEHINNSRQQHRGPAGDASPAWIVDYLATVSQDDGWELSRSFFEQHLKNGTAIVLLDGLDEAPDERQRKQVSALVQKTGAAFQKARLVITSRPAAYEGEAVLPDYAQVQIEHLEDDAIRDFLLRWSQRLFPENPTQAERHLEELLEALYSRVEIRRIARNPVMLTALAVVHWNEKRIPEQRADLYESILGWLARSRERRPGREPAERCINLLQDLALYMQDHKQGRQIQIPRREAAESIAKAWREGSEHERVRQAENFLRQDELDSGIIVARGDHVRFWHLTFQEYLAARGLAARTDQQQSQVLLRDPDKLFQPEWRETVLLFGGVLYHNGIEKVDHMVSEVLDGLTEVKGKGEGRKISLADAARCAGLLGAVVQDLAPVGYQPRSNRYRKLFKKVMGIFDAGSSQSTPIKVRIEAADALGRSHDPRFLPQNRAKNWVKIPAGSYQMKSTGNDVELDEFRIARYPVTVGEYAEFVEDGGYQDERWWSGGGFAKFSEPDKWDEQVQYPTRPVIYVSWYEAAAYAAWLNSRVPFQCRLPSEAEWERAAGGAEGREFPWGEEQADETRLNFDRKVGHPTPVGLYPLGATPDGIHDMAGNVWEWCLDWYHEKPPSGRNPVATEEASYRVMRGGSWFYSAERCRVADRNGDRPGCRYDYFGFRLAAVQSAR